MNDWMKLVILAVCVIAFVIYKKYRSGKSGNIANSGDELEFTPLSGEEFLERIKSASSADDLLDIVEEYYSADFSAEESAAFIARAESIRLPREGWLCILKIVTGENSPIEEAARQKSA